MKAIIVKIEVKIPLFLATAGIGRQVKLIIFCLSINISKILLMKATMTSTGNPNENKAIKLNWIISSEYSSIVPFTSPSSYDCHMNSLSTFSIRISSSLTFLSLFLFIQLLVKRALNFLITGIKISKTFKKTQMLQMRITWYLSSTIQSFLHDIMLLSH